jgi:hypothetical protein
LLLLVSVICFQVPAVCGEHCLREARLDLSQETILSEYFVQATNGRRGYVLLTSRGASWGEAQGAGVGLDSSEGAVEVARSVKWKELQIEEMKVRNFVAHSMCGYISFLFVLPGKRRTQTFRSRALCKTSGERIVFFLSLVLISRCSRGSSSGSGR